MTKRLSQEFTLTQSFVVVAVISMLYGRIEPMHHIHSRNLIHICILSFKLPFQSEYDALIGSVGLYSIEITTTTTKNSPEGLNILHLLCGERSTIFRLAIVQSCWLFISTVCEGTSLNWMLVHISRL